MSDHPPTRRARREDFSAQAQEPLNIERMRANLHATFNGGWHHSEDGMKAFHHGMDTVCNVLDSYQKGEHTNGILPAALLPVPAQEREPWEQHYYEVRRQRDELQRKLDDFVAALPHEEPQLREALAILESPEKWMQWCDARLLERCEHLESQLAALAHEEP